MKKINRQKLVLVMVSILALLTSLNISWSSPKPASVMAAVHHHDYPRATEITLVKPKVPVITESVEYVTIDGQGIKGYFAYPENMEEPLPGILAIHEWWGLNENIEAMTRRLAGEGYQVLAIDLYSGAVADTPAQAKKLVQSVIDSPFGAEANIATAYNYLVKERQSPSVASIGWCFGGSWSLETALMFPQELDAAIIYYGGQVGEKTPEELSTLAMPILGIFGREDKSIPQETVAELESTLNDLGKEASIIVYENAGHAFANPSGQNYVPEAAEAAWKETTEFLDQHLS